MIKNFLIFGKLKRFPRKLAVKLLPKFNTKHFLKVRFINFKNLLPRILPLSLPILFVIILFSPVLFFNYLFFNWDALFIYYPYMAGLSQDGYIWSQRVFGGFPISLNHIIAGNWVYIIWLIKFLSPLRAYFMAILFFWILTILFIYLLGRILGFGRMASAVFASVYIFSEHIISNWSILSLPVASALFITPALLYIFLKIINNNNSKSFLLAALGAILVGLSASFSHPQWLIMELMAAYFFWLYYIFRNKWKNKKKLFNFIFCGLFIVIFGLVISWWQLAPELKIGLESFRSISNFSSRLILASGLGPLEFLGLIFPLFQIPFLSNAYLYFGLLSLFIALYAIIYGWKKNDNNFRGFFYLLIIGLIISFKMSPLAWIFSRLPILKMFSDWSRFFDVTMLAIAYFVAFGLGLIWERRHLFSESLFNWTLKIFLILFVAFIFLVNVVGLFKGSISSVLVKYFDDKLYAKTSHLPLDYYHNLIVNLVNSFFSQTSIFNIKFFAVFIISVAGLLILLNIKKVNYGFIAISIILSSFLIGFILKPELISAKIYGKNYSIAEFLRKQNGIFRIYSVIPITSEYRLLKAVYGDDLLKTEDRVEFLRTMITVDSNMIDRFDSIDGFETYMGERTKNVLSQLLSENAGADQSILLDKTPMEVKLKYVVERLNLLGMMNVRYVISAFDMNKSINILEKKDTKFKEVFNTQATKFNIPIYVYENPYYLLRFYFAAQPYFADSSDKALSLLITKDFNFNVKTIIECSRCLEGTANKEDKFKTKAYKAGYLEVETNTRDYRWFIFSENKTYGWKAFLDGKEVPIYVANYLYQAILIPGGSHKLEFKFGWNIENLSVLNSLNK